MAEATALYRQMASAGGPSGATSAAAAAAARLARALASSDPAAASALLGKGDLPAVGGAELRALDLDGLEDAVARVARGRAAASATATEVGVRGLRCVALRALRRDACCCIVCCCRPRRAGRGTWDLL